jgi:molybdopterin converting factor small subunit
MGFVAVAIAVRTRYLARLRELAGVELEVMHATIGATLGDIYDAARAKHTSLPDRSAVRGAINLEFANWGSRVSDGDEIAFIPPVSGGRP